MARLNVWVPDELHAAFRAQLPDTNVSGLLQDAMRGVMGCDHELLACRRCAAPIDRHELLDERLSAFYGEFLHRLGPLVWRVGTAEGAARIAQEVACSFQVSNASLPLPRPNRANREAARDRAFEDAARAVTDPTPPRRRRQL